MPAGMDDHSKSRSYENLAHENVHHLTFENATAPSYTAYTQNGPQGQHHHKDMPASPTGFIPRLTRTRTGNGTDYNLRGSRTADSMQSAEPSHGTYDMKAYFKDQAEWVWKRTKRFFTSFLGVHYIYFASIVILASIVAYPIRNYSYTDILFMCMAHATQSGLNVVLFNDMRLYQQITLYCVVVMTTPIYVHSFVVFFRLYCFERYFKNIKINSKIQSKLRRTATMARADSAARTMSMDAAEQGVGNGSILHGIAPTQPRYRLNRAFFGTVGRHNNPFSQGHRHLHAYDDEDYNEGANRKLKAKAAPNQTANNDNDAEGNDRNIDSVLNSPTPRSPSPVPDSTGTAGAKQDQDKDIRFADLPQPPRRKQTLKPQDMYRSINMLQRERRFSGDVGDGPALVIKGPRELDLDNEEKEKKRSQHSSRTTSPIASSNNSIDIAHRPRLLTELMTHDSTMVNDPESSEDEQEHHSAASPGFTQTSTKFDDDDEEKPGDRIENKLRRRFSLPSAFRRSKSMDVQKPAGLLDGDDDDEKRFLDDADRRELKEAQRLRRAKTEQMTPFRHIASNLSNNLKRTKTFESLFRSNSQDLANGGTRAEPTMSTNYLSWEPTVGRNSVFIGLTDEQKEELGGVEYRSLKLLAKVLIVYYFGIGIIGAVAFLPYAYLKSNFTKEFYSEGYNPAWWSIYSSVSAFCNLGTALTPASYVPFQQSAYIPIWSMALIIVGNTGFPVFLRFILWILFKITPKYGHMHENLGFLLDHPRRCFTLLFPSRTTWILVLILLVLNGIDLFLFIVLDLKSPPIQVIPTGYRIMCGLFQAISTRTCGLTIFSMTDVHPAVRVSYMIMMYISVFPVAISMRRTNVYEEQSLGVYYDPDESSAASTNQTSFIANHLRRQLAFDFWFMFLALFCLCVTEDGKIRNGSFDVFDILFEVVSAYGTVGVSMGYKDTNLALSGGFSNLGKLIIIAVMYRGRHRGLPYALDRAIMFKGDNVLKADKIQASRTRHKHQLSMAKTNTLASEDYVYSPNHAHATGTFTSADYAEGPPLAATTTDEGLRNRNFQRVPSQAVED